MKEVEYSAAYRLAEEIKQSDEYRTYHQLKDTVMSDETQAALIREFQKLQVALQMNMITGRQNDPEEVSRFSALTTLLMSKQEISQYLMSEIQLQQTVADIMKIVTEAAGLDVQLPV